MKKSYHIRNIQTVLYEENGPKAKRRILIATIISLLLIALLLFFIVKTFADAGQFDGRYWSFFGLASTWRFIGEGLLGTLQSSLLAMAFAFFFGLLFMLLRICKYKPLNWIGTILINISRGIPTLLFIYFFLLVVPNLGIKLPSLLRISLPIAFSASGVVAEVLRSGVNAVSKGQKEAALSLGMKDSHIFFKILFPQGLKFVIPSLISELVIVLKDSTFSSILSYADLMQNAQVLISNHDAVVSVYFIISIIYILINFALSKISTHLSKKMGVNLEKGKVL